MNCPHCGRKNRPGLLLCEFCGHQLITLSDLSRFKTMQFNRADLGLNLEELAPERPVEAVPERKDKTPAVTLQLLDTEETLTLNASGHLSLGRADKDSSWQPTVDLTPYGAAEYGVSRMHADLFLENDQIFVLELGSANGTRINGQQVHLGQARLLYDGDMLELGRMRIKVNFG